MHKNIFLASYPKSGNTWLRSIIGNFYNFEKEFSLNDLKSIPLLSIKKHFNEFQNKVYINNNELHFDWVSQNIIKCQKILNNKLNHLNIFKTHSVRHKNFTNETVNAGFIYIVRDPRDIIVSLKNFSGKEIDKTIDEFLFSKSLMITTNGAQELLSTWELNVQSWLNYTSVPRLIIKYEDLKLNPKEIILNIKEFLNKIHSSHINLNDKDIDKIVENTNFNNLKKLEDKNGFDEATIHSNFFRSGTSNQWKDVLTNTQINLIEKNLKSMMRYFNYI
ncbi:sulfotransferase domain-containing protein [Pelagibacteraceae bacterium]|nr:sulfotransferase domain-containing protein [Pelagibacteraceae bacterium]